MSKQCLYDNPVTWRRELWRDGELLQSVCGLVLLEQRDALDRFLYNDISGAEYNILIHPWQKGVLHYGTIDAMGSQLDNYIEEYPWMSKE